VKDITGDPVIDPRTGQPLVYDKNSLQEMSSALARASEISGEPTPAPAPTPAPTGDSQTRIINGVRYQKVPGGWQKVR
jgi:hypothetical protein